MQKLRSLHQRMSQKNHPGESGSHERQGVSSLLCRRDG